MKHIHLRESGSETIGFDFPAAVFRGPGLVVEGWKQAKPAYAYIDKRVLRLRKGGQRLTTKVSLSK